MHLTLFYFSRVERERKRESENEKRKEEKNKIGAFVSSRKIIILDFNWIRLDGKKMAYKINDGTYTDPTRDAQIVSKRIVPLS